MNAVYGLYTTPESAQRAFDNLLAAGVPPGKITIMSSEPLEEYEFGRQDRGTVMSWLAILGAVLGLGGAYLLTSLTQQAWPISTGGMPIVSNWTNIIIMFEMTMLGAIIVTVFTLLLTARLPRKLPAFYDKEIANGRILVGVANPQEIKLSGIQQALQTGGAESLKTIR